MNKETEELAYFINEELDCCQRVQGMGRCLGCKHFNKIRGCTLAEHIAEALLSAGYYQDTIKESDKDRAMADIAIYDYWNDGKYICKYTAMLVHKNFDTYEEAYNANIDWLKKEHKGENEK